MAIETSETWARLRRSGAHREYRLEINGTSYGEDAIVSQGVDRELYEKFGFGNATCGKLSCTLESADIPRGAEIRRYVRLVSDGSAEVSEWRPAGIFYINRRSYSNGLWTVEAFDVMRKAEQPWTPRQDLTFPLSAPAAVAEFCAIMGVELDERTVLNPTYTVDYPASDPESETGDNYTIRQVLQFIAAMHGGNWIITPEGKLRLIGLADEPEETNYLVTEDGSPILFGEVLILVD